MAKFYPRRPRYRARRRKANYGMKNKKALKGFSKTQTTTLMRAIGRSDETKYYAADLWTNYASLDPAIHSPNADMLPLVPKVASGTGESQRIGRKIHPVKCKMDLAVGFTQPQIGNSAAASQEYANQIYVVVYLLRSKVYKNWQQFAGSTQWRRLMDNGDGTSTSFGVDVSGAGGVTVWKTDVRDMMRPIETSEFTLVKRKVIKLTKNPGLVDTGPVGTAVVPNLPQTSYRGTLTYKLPDLSYDDSAIELGGYPTNANVFVAIGYCRADINSTEWNTPGGVVQNDPIISVSARNHVWFKDS